MLFFSLLYCYVFDLIMKYFQINLFMIILDSNFYLKWSGKKETQEKNQAGLMDLHICTNRDNRGSRIHWDSSQHSHSLLALLLPSSASPPICSYSFSDDNVSREARRSKWHRENGMKGKGNNTLQKQPHYWGLLLSEFSKASPFPSSICLSCTLEAVTQKLCLLLPAPAAKVWGQLWGPGTAWFMNS